MSSCLGSMCEEPVACTDQDDCNEEKQGEPRKINVKRGDGPVTPTDDSSFTSVIAEEPFQNEEANLSEVIATPRGAEESEAEEEPSLHQEVKLTIARCSSPGGGEHTSSDSEGKPLLSQGTNPPNPDVSASKKHEPHTLSHIKEEPCSNQAGDLPHSDISTYGNDKPPISPAMEEPDALSAEQPSSEVPAQRQPAEMKAEPIIHEDGIPQHLSTSTENIHCPSAQIKEEALSPENQELSDTEISTPSGCAQCLSVSVKEEPLSSEEDTNPRLMGAVKHSEIHSFTITGDYLEDMELKHKTKARTDQIASTSSKTTYSCPVCRRTFSNHGHLVRHRETYKGRKMSCLECGANFCNKTHLSLHARIHKVSRVLYCSECNKTFPSLSHLKIHERAHTGERPLTCTQCGKQFTSKSKLGDHMKMHTGSKGFCCTVCGKSYAREENLLSHQRIHEEEISFICSHCGRTFVDPHMLAKHQRFHSLDKPYSCGSCGKKFTHKTFLLRHERTHVNGCLDCTDCGKSFLGQHNLSQCSVAEKPFECSACGKRFTKEPCFLNHQKLHTGEKAFECSDCGNCFKQKNILVRHQKIHDVEKPFWCHECEKGFTTRSNLKVHRRVHILRRQHPCPHCGKEFPFKSKLNEHLKSHEESTAGIAEVQT